MDHAWTKPSAMRHACSTALLGEPAGFSKTQLEGWLGAGCWVLGAAQQATIQRRIIDKRSGQSKLDARTRRWPAVLLSPKPGALQREALWCG